MQQVFFANLLHPHRSLCHNRRIVIFVQCEIHFEADQWSAIAAEFAARAKMSTESFVG